MSNEATAIVTVAAATGDAGVVPACWSAFLILPEREDDLRRAVERLQKKARKLGLQGPSVRWLGTKMVPETRDGEATGRAFERLSVEICEERIVLKGWRHIATLERLSGGNLVKEVPGETVPVKYRTESSRCDHCKAARHRTETFVLAHEDGRCVQIGRQCLSDFLGNELAAYWASGFELEPFARELSDECSEGGYPRGKSVVALETFLSVCCGWVRSVGFVSRKMVENDQSGRMTTADMAWRHFELTAKKDEKVEELPADRERALAIIGWGKALTPKPDNTYEHNLKLLLGGTHVERSGGGFVASAVMAYDRAMGQLLERVGRAPSEYIGEPGKKLRAVVTCFAAVSLEGVHGCSTLYILRTDKNELVKWNSSGSVQLDRQGRYLLEGTVKEKGHSEYVRDGVSEKQTSLTRCQVLASLGPAMKPGMVRPVEQAVFEEKVMVALGAYEASAMKTKDGTRFGLALRQAEAELEGRVYVPPAAAPKKVAEPPLKGTGVAWAGYEARVKASAPKELRVRVWGYGRTAAEAVARLGLWGDETQHEKVTKISLLDLSWEERNTPRGRAMADLAEMVCRQTYGASYLARVEGQFATAAKAYFDELDASSAPLLALASGG